MRVIAYLMRYNVNFTVDLWQGPHLLGRGVLVFRIVLEDSVLYIMASESAEDTKIDLRDKLTGVRFSLQLSSQHGAIALISKKNKSVIVKYGF